jgi:O-6-methylguanine DNA methyltransferase
MADRHLQKAERQIHDYLRGRRRDFDLPLDIEGTAFQKKVWALLRRIPYGKTRSYKEIAGALGVPKASRAVGAAIGRNPLCLIVPCHRVIGADGGLCGYVGGLPVKRRLLSLEGLDF